MSRNSAKGNYSQLQSSRLKQRGQCIHCQARRQFISIRAALQGGLRKGGPSRALRTVPATRRVRWHGSRATKQAVVPSAQVDSVSLRAVLAFDERIAPLLDVPGSSGSDPEIDSPAAQLLSRVLVDARPAEAALDAWKSLGPKGFRLIDASLAFSAARIHARGHAGSLQGARELGEHVEALLNACTAELARLDRRHARRLQMSVEAGHASSQPLPGPAVLRRAAQQSEALLRAAACITRGLDSSPSISNQDARLYKRSNDIVIGAVRCLRNASVLPAVAAQLQALEAAAADVPAIAIESGRGAATTRGPLGALALMAWHDPSWASRVLLPILDGIRAVDACMVRLADAARTLVDSDMHSHALLKELQGLCLDPRLRAALPRELSMAVAACPSPAKVLRASARRDPIGSKQATIPSKVTQRARVSIEATLGAIGVPDGGEPVPQGASIDSVASSADTMDAVAALHHSLDAPLLPKGTTSALVAAPLSCIASFSRSFSLARWCGDGQGRLWTAIGRAAGVAASAPAVPRVRPLDPTEVVGAIAAAVQHHDGSEATQRDGLESALPASFRQQAELDPAKARISPMPAAEGTLDEQAGRDELDDSSDDAEWISVDPPVFEGHLEGVFYEEAGAPESSSVNTARKVREGLEHSKRLSAVLEEQEQGQEGIEPDSGPKSLLDHAIVDSHPVDWRSLGRPEIEKRLFATHQSNVGLPRDGLSNEGSAGMQAHPRHSIFRSLSGKSSLRFAGIRPESLPASPSGESLAQLQRGWMEADAEVKLEALSLAHVAHLALARLSPLAPQAALLDTALPASACKSAFVAKHAQRRTSMRQYVAVRDAVEDSGLMTPIVDLVVRDAGLPVAAAWPEVKAGLDVLSQAELLRPTQAGANLDWTAAAAEGRRMTTTLERDFDRRMAQLAKALGPARIKSAAGGGLEAAAGRALAEAYTQARLSAGSQLTTGGPGSSQSGTGSAPKDRRNRQASDPIPGVSKKIRDILTLPVRAQSLRTGSVDGGSFEGRVGRGGAVIHTPEGSLLRALASGGDDDLVVATERAMTASRRGRRRPRYTSSRDGGAELPAVLRRDKPAKAGAPELATALSTDQHMPLLGGSYVVRKPRQAREAGHSSLSIRDGTFVPVPRVPDTARLLASAVREARERVVAASKELRRLLGKSASRRAEDIGLLPVDAPIRGKVQFLPVGRQLRPGSKRGSPVLLPAQGVQLGIPAGAASRKGGALAQGGHSRVVEGTAGVPLSMPVPGGPIDAIVAREAEEYSASVRELDRSSGGLVSAAGSHNLMLGTPDRLPEHRQLWQLDQPVDGEYDETLEVPARDSKLLEEPPIPLEEQSLDTADVFQLPPDERAQQLQLAATRADGTMIESNGRSSLMHALESVGSTAGDSPTVGATASSGSEGVPEVSHGSETSGARGRHAGKSRSSAVQVHRSLVAGSLGPDGPKSDEFSGELLVPRLPLETVQTAKAPAMVVAEAQERLATALADEHRAVQALQQDASGSALPPALLRIWSRDGGMSKEEEAYLKQRDRFALPAARLRHDVLRASGWDLVTLPFDHWSGVQEDRRRRLLSMTLPRTVRRQRAPDELPVQSEGSKRGGGESGGVY